MTKLADERTAENISVLIAAAQSCGLRLDSDAFARLHGSDAFDGRDGSSTRAGGRLGKGRMTLRRILDRAGRP